ncbi:MAG: Hpt domain-containing protein [Defluviitaleaceae bacterium]|nr:Hpt domain-containing protein [Defluviitaleaceae bacterium]
MDAVRAISLEDGLKRVVNNKKIFQTLLKKFSGRELVDKISAAIASNEPEEAMKACHALKGVAANLAMNPLAETLGKMEEQLKNGTSTLLPELEERLTAVEQEIEEFLQT